MSAVENILTTQVIAIVLNLGWIADKPRFTAIWAVLFIFISKYKSLNKRYSIIVAKKEKKF